MFSELTEIFITFTRNCNLRCSYCYQDKNYKEINITTIDKLIEFIQEHKKIQRILLFGGEPYLALEQINYFIDKLIELKNTTNRLFYVGSISNGTLYNAEVKKFFEKVTKYFLFFYIVSIDGIKETHDANRRTIDDKPTYDIMMKNLKTIKKEYPKVRIHYHSVISHNTIDKFYDFAKSILRNNLLNHGSCKYLRNTSIDQQYTIEDFEKVYKTLKLLNKEGYTSTYLLSIFEPLISTIDYRFNNFNKEQEVCVHGKESVLIDTDGKMYPCSHYLSIPDDERAKFYIYDLHSGFNNDRKDILEKVKNISCNSNYNCKECSNFSSCYICSASIDVDGECGMKAECKHNRMLSQAAKNVKFILE